MASSNLQEVSVGPGDHVKRTCARRITTGVHGQPNPAAIAIFGIGSVDLQLAEIDSAVMAAILIGSCRHNAHPPAAILSVSQTEIGVGHADICRAHLDAEDCV